MAPATSLSKPGAEAPALAAVGTGSAPASAEHSSSSEVALASEATPQPAHGASPPAAAGSTAPLAPALPALGPLPPQLGLGLPQEEEEPLRITVDAKERLRWSPALHQRFCQAVAELGGSAYAKPKDIVARMRVPGLTLAHVKSHLQKFRQSEGITVVPNAARGYAASLRRLQQQLPPLPGASLGTSGASELEHAPPPGKRARSSATAPLPPGLVAASSGVWPGLPSLPGGEGLPSFLSTLGQSPGAAAAAEAVPVLLAQPVALALPPLPLPGAPAAACLVPPAPAEHPEDLERLLELADLAAAQHDELVAARQQLEREAAGLDGLGQQLAAAAPAGHAHSPSAAAQQPEGGARLAALLEQQQQLKSAVAAHLQQHAHLLDQLADLRRSAADALGEFSPQGLTPAQLQKVQHAQQQQKAPAVHTAVEPTGGTPAAEQAAPQPTSQQQPVALDHPAGRVAAATAALKAAVQQPLAAGAGAPAAPGAAEPPAGTPPHIACLLSLIASAANLAPHQAPPALATGPALDQLRHLYQQSAGLLVAARQQG